MTIAPKCKLCGANHWAREPHRFKDVTPAVTQARSTVTRPVTPSVIVTPPVTEAMMIDAAVHDRHECPICGLMHGRPKSDAERAKAYRERRK